MTDRVKNNTAEEYELERWAHSDERIIREDAVIMGSTQEERDEMREVLWNAASEEQKKVLSKMRQEKVNKDDLSSSNLSESEQREYSILADRAERGELKPIGNIHRGEEAKESARALLRGAL